ASCALEFRTSGTTTGGYRLENFVIFDERRITERAPVSVFEQKCATMRAYLYHWSVLRCGSSSDGTQPW
ncbi:MAG: hypothetical protein ACREQC_12605, partial [Candidatus Binataceae bacterium]